MQVQRTSYQPNFQARFLHSESLRQVVEYAVEHGKFDKLNTARKNINSYYRDIPKKIFVSVGKGKNNCPFVEFTILGPKRYTRVPNSIDDYRIINKITYQADKKVNPLKFALEKIIKLGNNAPNNKMYQSLMY